jgi:uncharacterized membrane protein
VCCFLETKTASLSKISRSAKTLIGSLREFPNFFYIKNIRSIRIFEIEKKLHVDFHIEIDGNLTLAKAHDLSTELETRIKGFGSSIIEVSYYVEPKDSGIINTKGDSYSGKAMAEKVENLIKEYPEINFLIR